MLYMKSESGFFYHSKYCKMKDWRQRKINGEKHKIDWTRIKYFCKLKMNLLNENSWKLTSNSVTILNSLQFTFAVFLNKFESIWKIFMTSDCLSVRLIRGLTAVNVFGVTAKTKCEIGFTAGCVSIENGMCRL